MNRHAAWALGLVLGACAPDAGPEVNAALQHYARLVAAMAHDSIAAQFTADGEAVTAGQPTITGPDAIRAHLQSFVNFHVLAEELVADTTRVTDDHAYQTGTYHQRVQIPRGDTIEVRGRFTVDWVREPDRGWRIRRMATRPPG